ncbi:hypothetical protein ACLOJK_013113 [Asimina triloba]
MVLHLLPQGNSTGRRAAGSEQRLTDGGRRTDGRQTPDLDAWAIWATGACRRRRRLKPPDLCLYSSDLQRSELDLNTAVGFVKRGREEPRWQIWWTEDLEDVSLSTMANFGRRRQIYSSGEETNAFIVARRPLKNPRRNLVEIAIQKSNIPGLQSNGAAKSQMQKSIAVGDSLPYLSSPSNAILTNGRTPEK